MSGQSYYDSIPDQVFEDIALSQITSIREDSFDDLLKSLGEGKLQMLLNPNASRIELQHALTLHEQLISELIRVTPLLISMALGAFAVHVDNFLWLLMILLLPVVYFVRALILPLVNFIIPSLLLVIALSTFVYWSIPGILGGCTLLIGSLWAYGLSRYSTARLTQKALSSEVRFIEFYFKNVFLLYRDNRLLNSPGEVEGFIEYSYKHFPEKLSGKEMLYYCKRCTNRDYSQQQGIVCGLTKARPKFENECPDFNFDPERAQYEDSILATRIDWIAESQFTIRLIPYFLYGTCFVFFLSEVNFWYSGIFFSAFRSGITDWLHLREIYQPWSPYYGLIIPGLLLITGILASTGKKWAYIAGFLVFLTDTAFTLIALNGTITWWIHLSILAALFAGIKEIDNVKAFTKSLIGNG